jgi:colanic acid/amylovoran biosynthesis protein
MSKNPDNGKRILIVNAHSQANAGDFAIMLGQIRLLKKLFPGTRLTVTSRTPRLDRPSMAARGVEVIAPVFRAPSGFRGRWRGWAGTILSLLFPRQALTFLRHLRRADLVFACGGGYFYSTRRVPGFTFWQNYLPIRLAILQKKDIIFFPQSYGPLHSPLSRRLLAGLLASSFVRVVFAREQISLSILKGLLPVTDIRDKMQICPDMAFCYEPEPEFILPAPVFSDLPRPRLALALRDWSFPGQKTSAAKKRERENYLQGVIATCLALHAKYNASFIIFNQVQGPGAEEDDRRITRIVLGRLAAGIASTHLRYVETPIAASPAMILRLLQQVDVLLTSRMHAAIFAFLAGIPAVVIGYQHKSAGVLRSMGLEACSLPIEKTRKETLFPLCATVLQNRGAWQEKIRRAVSEATEAIEEKFAGLF